MPGITVFGTLFTPLLRETLPSQAFFMWSFLALGLQV